MDSEKQSNGVRRVTPFARWSYRNIKHAYHVFILEFLFERNSRIFVVALNFQLAELPNVKRFDGCRFSEFVEAFTSVFDAF